MKEIAHIAFFFFFSIFCCEANLLVARVVTQGLHDLGQINTISLLSGIVLFYFIFHVNSTFNKI